MSDSCKHSWKWRISVLPPHSVASMVCIWEIPSVRTLMAMRGLGAICSFVYMKLFKFLQCLVCARHVWLPVDWQKSSTVSWEKFGGRLPGALQNSVMAETYMLSTCYWQHQYSFVLPVIDAQLFIIVCPLVSNMIESCLNFRKTSIASFGIHFCAVFLLTLILFGIRTHD